MEEAQAAIDTCNGEKFLEQTINVDYAFVRPPPNKSDRRDRDRDRDRDRGGRGHRDSRRRSRSPDNNKNSEDRDGAREDDIE